MQDLKEKDIRKLLKQVRSKEEAKILRNYLKQTIKIALSNKKDREKQRLLKQLTDKTLKELKKAREAQDTEAGVSNIISKIWQALKKIESVGHQKMNTRKGKWLMFVFTLFGSLLSCLYAGNCLSLSNLLSAGLAGLAFTGKDTREFYTSHKNLEDALITTKLAVTRKLGGSWWDKVLKVAFSLVSLSTAVPAAVKKLLKIIKKLSPTAWLKAKYGDTPSRQTITPSEVSAFALSKEEQYLAKLAVKNPKRAKLLLTFLTAVNTLAGNKQSKKLGMLLLLSNFLAKKQSKRSKQQESWQEEDQKTSFPFKLS